MRHEFIEAIKSHSLKSLNASQMISSCKADMNHLLIKSDNCSHYITSQFVDLSELIVSDVNKQYGALSFCHCENYLIWKKNTIIIEVQQWYIFLFKFHQTQQLQ